MSPPEDIVINIAAIERYRAVTAEMARAIVPLLQDADLTYLEVQLVLALLMHAVQGFIDVQVDAQLAADAVEEV